MLYTNQKIIVHDTNDLDELEHACDELKAWMIENVGINAELELSEHPEKGFPMVELPKEVTWKYMDECLRPGIGLRAINEDKIKFDVVEDVKIQHDLTEDEEIDIGRKLAEIIKKEAEVQQEKKIKMAEFKAEIEALDSQLWDFRDQIANGYRYDDMKCIIQYDFEEKKKYFCDVNNPENILKVEAMEPGDYQLRIDHTFDAKVVKLEPATAEGEAEEETPDLSESDMDDYAEEMVASGSPDETDLTESDTESEETGTESEENDTEESKTGTDSATENFEKGNGELDFES